MGNDWCADCFALPTERVSDSLAQVKLSASGSPEQTGVQGLENPVCAAVYTQKNTLGRGIDQG